MSNESEQDAGAAPTENASEQPEQDTDLAPTQHAPEQVQAWSLDETDEMQSARHGRIVSAALIVLLCAVVAAVTWFAATFFGWPPSKSDKPTAIRTTAPAVTSTPVALRRQRLQ
jgi:hypothetical protein